MSAAVELEREFLTRKEAAEYLSRRWFKISVATLNKHAVKHDGPKYTNRGPNGGEAMYRLVDLDAWSRAFIDKPLGKRRAKQMAVARKPRARSPLAVAGALGALATVRR